MKKKHNDIFPYDQDLHCAVVRASICTGEKAAGFKNKADGRFHEVMLIRTPEDMQEFKRIYGLNDVKVEY
ncbi:MAG: aspartate dehydrogenase [Clostridia bacterium]|nr:aspartate dehydrogenase [Clostridia bacterium]